MEPDSQGLEGGERNTPSAQGWGRRRPGVAWSLPRTQPGSEVVLSGTGCPTEAPGCWPSANQGQSLPHLAPALQTALVGSGGQQSPFHHCSAKTSLSGGEGQEGLGFSSQHESYVLISSFKKNNDAAFIHEAWSAESGQNLLFDPAHSFLFSFFPKTGERCMWRGEGTCVS